MLGETSKGDMAKGTIYFRPPSYLKLMQETPEAETVLVNEDTIWWYVPKKKIVYRYPSDEFGKELKLLSDIFSGLLKVEEKFRLVKLPDNKSGEHLISLYPDPPWQEVDHVVLTVTSGHEIVGVDIYNLLGGITRFRLLETMKKDLFEEGFFDFQVPEGVQVKEGKNQ
jgi:outer membrane lipoprotein-sorting protein